MNSKIARGTPCPKCGQTMWMQNIFKTTGYGADEKQQVGRFCISCAYFEPMNGENLCGIDGDIPAIKSYVDPHSTRKNRKMVYFI